MTRRAVLAACALVGAACGPTQPSAGPVADAAEAASAAPAVVRLGLAFVANRRGVLEPPACRVAPEGGLARFAGLLARADAARGWDGRLALDLGDTALPAPGRAPEGAREARLASARFLVEQHNRLGLDGWVPGETDLDLGAEAMAELRAAARFPVLAANVFDWETGRPAFDQGLVVRVAGVRVGLFGLTLPVDTAAGQRRRGLPWRVADPVPVARAQEQALRAAGAEVVVAAAHLPAEELATLGREVPGIDVILGGHDAPATAEPTLGDGAGVRVSAGVAGAAVGLLTLVLTPGAAAPRPLVDLNRAERLRARQAALQAELARASDTSRGGANPEWVARVRADLALAAQDLAEAAEPAPGTRGAAFLLQPLDESVPADPGVAEAVAEQVR